MDIKEPYPAYCFDNAVAEWGVWIESQLQKVEGDNPKIVRRRRERKLEALLTGKKSKMFADPMAKFAQGGES